MDKIFNTPFAQNGARVTIPEFGTENDRVSFDKGFTQPYEVEAPSVDNPAGQGYNILRPEMNEALNLLSNACNFLAENIDKWTLLTTENLNDIKQAGRYYQNRTVNASIANNYPINLAGYLIVLNTGIESYGVTQIYKVWNSEKVFIRRTTSTNDWSAWDSFVLTSEFNSKITQLQNADTNLNNNKEDKTKFTNGVINATLNSNLNNLTQNGFYWRTADTGSPLPTTNGGAVIVNTNGSQVIQYFFTDIWNSENGGVWFRTRYANNVWTDWHHLENSEHAEATYRKIADSYTKSETEAAIGRLIQFGAGNNVKFTNYLNKSTIVVAGFARIVAMSQPQGAVDIQLYCRTTGEQSNTMRFYTNGSATDATGFYMASFNTYGNNQLEFEIRVFSGQGNVDNAMFLAQFY